LPRTKGGAPAPGPVVRKIVDASQDFHDKIVGGRKPSMKFPLHSLSKVCCAPKKGRFEMAGKKENRTLPVARAITFAWVRAFAKDDLDFMIDRYLPGKLEQAGNFLP